MAGSIEARPDVAVAEPAISDICGALAVVTISGATAGIISLAGLRLGAPLIDGDLAALDSALLIDRRPLVIAAANAPILGGLMGLAYLSSFPILFALVASWLDTTCEAQLTFVFTFTAVGCATLSALFPAAGAFSYFAYPAEVLGRLPSGAGVYHLEKFEYYRRAATPAISMTSLEGVVTFPSFPSNPEREVNSTLLSITW